MSAPTLVVTIVAACLAGLFVYAAIAAVTRSLQARLYGDFSAQTHPVAV